MNYNETLMWKEINETSDIFSKIMGNNCEVMDALIREISDKNIRNITGAARGTSDHALIYFKYLVEVFTELKVGLAGCSAVTVYDGKVNYGDNLVIGVSQSGKAADVLALLERAKSQGAITLAVTNNPDSPMAKAAKYHLYCSAGAELSVAATKTFSSQAFLLMWLAARLSGNDKLLASLDNLPNAINKDFEAIKSQAEKLSGSLYKADGGFVLARGISYAIALESTLKLQETSYLLMKGYAESDFQHGPMAMVGKGTPILIYAPSIGFVSQEAEKTLAAAFNAAAKRLSGFGGEVFIITDNDSYSEYNSFKLPSDGYEPTTFFRLALFAQMLACFVSCKKGLSPDSPRALNKVTITK